MSYTITLFTLLISGTAQANDTNPEDPVVTYK